MFLNERTLHGRFEEGNGLHLQCIITVDHPLPDGIKCAIQKSNLNLNTHTQWDTQQIHSWTGAACFPFERAQEFFQFQMQYNNENRSDI